jgi:hypothetical protein
LGLLLLIFKSKYYLCLRPRSVKSLKNIQIKIGFILVYAYGREASRNPNITYEIVQQNPDKPWDYDELSENPNITYAGGREASICTTKSKYTLEL